MSDSVEDRLSRMMETKRQAPDSTGNLRDTSVGVVTEAWLAQVFEIDHKVLKQKLRFCPVVRSVRRGRTMITNYYAIKEAARFLVVPAVTTQDVLRELKRGQLPPSLQQSVWDALLKRQTWEERAGQLWRTEKVREVLGGTFQNIKFTTQLWAETVERTVELSEEQRDLIVSLSDTLLGDIYAAMLEQARKGMTGPQLSEMSELVGEETTVKGVVHAVESDEDDVEYTIERLV